MEDYFQAKARLFTPRRSRLGVVNLDDEYGRRLVHEAPSRSTFSAEGDPDADWRAVDVEIGPLGSTFTVVGPKGERSRASAPLPGPFNVANTLAAIVALAVAGLDPQAAADGIAAVPGVPGRLERVDAGQPYLAVVDYAHKTDAVESVLRALRKVTKGRLHVVLGCGGDRDPTKRGADGRRRGPARRHRRTDLRQPALRGPAGDPRHDARGRRRGAGARARRGLVVEDRAAAIAAAVAPRAEPGDTVLVAGKGHEQGQDIAGVVRPSTTARYCARPSSGPRDEPVIALTLAEIAEAVGGQTYDIPDPARQVTGPVVIDSREVEPGSLFVAFVGERVDGHDFAGRGRRGGRGRGTGLPARRRARDRRGRRVAGARRPRPAVVGGSARPSWRSPARRARPAPRT